MGAVFTLLTRGQQSFEREPEIADLQQSARTALDLVTRDILQAGAGLPPEFPAFSRINGAGDSAPTDVLEIIGTFQSAGNVYLEPEEVASVDLAGVVILRENTSNLELTIRRHPRPTKAWCCSTTTWQTSMPRAGRTASVGTRAGSDWSRRTPRPRAPDDSELRRVRPSVQLGPTMGPLPECPAEFAWSPPGADAQESRESRSFATPPSPTPSESMPDRRPRFF